MANTGMEIDPLEYVDKIVDFCVGNTPAGEIGANEFSTFPEALSKLDTTPGDRNALQFAIKYTGILKSKVVFLETQLLRLRRMQERGIIR